MNKTLLASTLVLLLAPSAASAAKVTADIDMRQGAPFGPVVFKAAMGERNLLTVTAADGKLRFRDRANPVRARGDCRQVNRHTAVCSYTEDTARARLGNGADRAAVEGLVTVRGGKGRDRLRGSSGADKLDGQRGRDVLHGRGGSDDLGGGPGRDLLVGGGGDDNLIDGEGDRHAAPDVFRGGSSSDGAGTDRGDTVDYSERKENLNINLGRRAAGAGAGGDVLRNMESVIGGSGDDRLVGDGDDNWLVGRDGDDFLRGRFADDNLQGGDGNDTVRGDFGADVLWGGRDADLFQGLGGDDTIVARDAHAEDVRCGTGDDTVLATPLDTLDQCETATSRDLAVTIQPDVQGNIATYSVACLSEDGCSGTLSLQSLDGVDYGSGEFGDLPHGADVFSDVEVDLTPEGRSALGSGEVVVVSYGDSGGYRAFTRR